MKARSFVFAHLQWPVTIFGLPPKLAIGAVLVAFVAYTACIVFRVTFLMVPATVVTGITGLAWAYTLGKKDRHIETVFLPTKRFWGSSPCRRLLAGVPPSRSRGGRP